MATSNPFIDSLEPFYKKLVQTDGNLDHKKLAAIHRFNENLVRLQWRYDALAVVDAELLALPDRKRETQEIQLDFVDKTEAYYQQLYATLSAFAMLLNKLLPHEKKRGLSISSIKAFLEWLEKLSPEVAAQVKDLEKARDFRGKFIDHVQQHELHDWITTTNMTGPDAPDSALVFFIRKNEQHEAVFRPDLNPYSPSYEPPVNHSGFYVSPQSKKTHRALQDTVRCVLSSL